MQRPNSSRGLSCGATTDPANTTWPSAPTLMGPPTRSSPRPTPRSCTPPSLAPSSITSRAARFAAVYWHSRPAYAIALASTCGAGEKTPLLLEKTLRRRAPPAPWNAMRTPTLSTIAPPPSRGTAPSPVSSLPLQASLARSSKLSEASAHTCARPRKTAARALNSFARPLPRPPSTSPARAALRTTASPSYPSAPAQSPAETRSHCSLSTQGSSAYPNPRTREVDGARRLSRRPRPSLGPSALAKKRASSQERSTPSPEASRSQVAFASASSSSPAMPARRAPHDWPTRPNAHPCAAARKTLRTTMRPTCG